MKKVLLAILFIGLLMFIYASTDKSPDENTISEKLKKWKSSSKTFKFKNFNISYHDTNDSSKEVILLLHGYPSSSFDWNLLWDELKKEYRLVAIDMLGFGLSDKPNDIDYSISIQTDIQEAFLKQLGIKRFHILAHDYGDNVAQELIARLIDNELEYPFKIRSVTLLNGGLFPETHQATVIQTLLGSPIGSYVSSLINKPLFDNSFKKVFGENTKPSKQDLIDQWYLICKNKGNRINNKLVHAIKDRIVNKERWENSIKYEKIPIVFINGLQDPVTGKSTVDRYMAIVPNPNVIKLKSIGHFPQLESPELIVKHVTEFINTIY
ncbi:alpha/beta fold hydrolase [Tenacibaculum sp. MEBiC06402]|uniref:alpha/beta fold hydrolase n=1 Tax=unclassified Tenacibaculum TaxID=2635139 RepID=UPI003B9D38B4